MMHVESTIDWQALERRIRPWVAQRVGPADVDDVMQEVWIRMHRSLHQLRTRDVLVGWVRGIARSAVADHQRMRMRHPLVRGEDATETTIGASTDAGDDHGDGDPGALLTNAMVVFVAALPRAYREALTLTELEGLTQAKAAEILGISLPAMKSRVLRGRERLRTMIDSCCEVALDARNRVVQCTPRAFGDVPADCCS